MEQRNEKSVRHRRNNVQILQLLEEFEKSKTTVKDFCRQNNINTGNFHKWRSRYKGKAIKRARTTGFTTLDVIAASPVQGALFAEVHGIKIYQRVDAAYLKELMS